MMMYAKVVTYAVHRDTETDAQAAWDDDGPELAESGGVELVVDGELIETSAGFTNTPNGFDPLWVEAINHVLADRGCTLRANDLDDHLWTRFLGPLCDQIEDGYAIEGAA